jgi:transglutaminase-like putative cysteine protease
VNYTLRHLTRYAYASPVAFARCNLRLTPAHGDGQHLVACDIAVEPRPSTRSQHPDFFGTETVALTVDAPHRELTIEAQSRVRVARPAPPAAASTPAWETVREAALASDDLGPDSPVHHLAPTRRVPLLPEATDYARASFPAGRPVLEGARDLTARIARDFTFDARATTVSTPLAEVARLRRGVCQDFAHLMIAALRGLSLPAAYVSGYLRTIPPPGRPRLRGADASHAWVAVWCGGEWVGLDPTNDCVVGNDHIVVARGRDYGDVCPVDGIIATSGAQKLTVEVDVIPDGEPA